MFIQKLVLNNFKGYVGRQEFEFSDKVNYFVGDNNSGKTTIFNAIEILFSGKDINEFRNNTVNETVSIEVTLADVEEMNVPDKAKKYIDYIGPDKTLVFTKNSGDPKKVLVSKPDTNPAEFVNVTGTGNTITALFDPQPIYADLSNDSVQTLKSSGQTGKLLSRVAENFVLGAKWAEFKEAHAEAFKSGEGSLAETTKELTRKINQKIQAQFGDAQVSFEFELPDASELIKNGLINIEENGVKTPAGLKGNGLQRALALAVLQVYADMNASTEEDETPFLVDEPELYMHPTAQDKLMKALVSLSRTNQVFVTTHSPYILRNFRPNSDSVLILSDDVNNRAARMTDLVLPTPTIAEITYRAFNVPTVDLHQDLFTKVYLYWIANLWVKKNEKDRPSLLLFDQYLKDQNVEVANYTPRYSDGWKDTQENTLPYIVRNEIDHPEVLEGGKNVWSEDNLEKSIDILISLYTTLRIGENDEL